MKVIVLCRNCRYSELEANSTWNLVCLHPNVNAENGYMLGSNQSNGSSCTTERSKISLFAPCGQKGKLFEAKT